MDSLEKIEYLPEQLTYLKKNIKSYKILFFILCKRKLSDPIKDEEIQEISEKINTYNYSFLEYPLARLTDDTIYNTLYTLYTIYIKHYTEKDTEKDTKKDTKKDTENLLLDALNTIQYNSYVESYRLLMEGNNESLSDFFNNHTILYAAITDGYDKEIRYLCSNDEINIFLFSFCLLKAYVLNNYLFNLDLYNDTSIIRKFLTINNRRYYFFNIIKERNNYSYLYKNFMGIKNITGTGNAFLLFKTILHNLIFSFGENDKQKNGGDLTLKQQRKYTLILYLMGIDLLKELMETQINIGTDMDRTDDMDTGDDEQIDEFIKLTCVTDESTGQPRGLAGGRRRRIIRRLKSYK
jgi:hypothetical protein